MTVTDRRGLVVARHRRELAIELTNGKTTRALVHGRKLKPLVGDRVLLREEDDGTAVVETIEPRATLLERIDKRNRREGVAANVTLIAIVIAPEPGTDWQLVDRYLVAAELIGIAAAVVRHKRDIPDAGLDRRAAAYARLGYSVVETSTRSGAGLEAAARLLESHRTVLTGQSGVGKSSLINALLGTEAQATQPLSERKAIGRHTTTAARLHRLPGGGEIIDSPGVRRYAPNIDSQADIARGFVEFREFAPYCRFNDCGHIDEPGCRVTEAVESGAISDERYSSYRALATTRATLGARGY